jgi:hypothetical protein
MHYAKHIAFPIHITVCMRYKSINGKVSEVIQLSYDLMEIAPFVYVCYRIRYLENTCTKNIYILVEELIDGIGVLFGIHTS